MFFRFLIKIIVSIISCKLIDRRKTLIKSSQISRKTYSFPNDNITTIKSKVTNYITNKINNIIKK